MELTQLVHRLGDVVRVRALRANGASRHSLASALAVGELVRIRAGWVALPGADGELVAAARAGVVLTCVTEARRLGLWVLEEDRLHVAADPHAGGVRAPDSTVHWARPLVPRHPDALIDPVENVLGIVAACQPHEAALAVWESALRTERVARESVARLPLGGQAK